MAKSEVVKDGWFYLGTYFEGESGDARRPPEERSPKCTLLARHVELRRGPSGKLRVGIKTEAPDFPNEEAMVAWIEEHAATELPEAADGNPRYVPEEYLPENVEGEFASDWVAHA